MSPLVRLRSANDIHDLAEILGFKAKSIAYILYQLSDDMKYKSFQVEKRSGGARTIHVPEARLKLLQKRLATILAECREEIRAGEIRKKDVSHGFERSRSIKTNARNHVRKKYVFNLDLNDFFGCINFGRVRGFFVKNKNFGLQPKIATLIAQIACHNNAIPQGAPCSPVISNLLADSLDRRLDRLAKTHRCRYSRYADDITFSSRLARFPDTIAVFEWGHWRPSDHVLSTVESCGFSVNHYKTRMQFGNSRQAVTGLVVNEKVNIRRELMKELRAQVDSYVKNGQFHFNRADGSKQPGTESQLEGRLAFACSIVLKDGLKPDDERRSTGVVGQAKRFWLAKNFLRQSKPVVLCEGKTDVVYLRSAIRSLGNKYPDLVTIAPKAADFKIRFVNLDSFSAEIMGLGGADTLRKFIATYSRVITAGATPEALASPVIIVVDNDQGATKVFSTIASVTKNKVKVTLDTTEDFYHVADNLFVIKVPEKLGDKDMYIEKLFSSDVLSTKLNGKTLEIGDKFDPNKNYGKHIFAERVVRPNSESIDFSGFIPLLDRLKAAIAAHTS